MKRKTVITIVAVVIGFAVGGVWLNRQLDIDRCLDNGGRWSYDSAVCEFEPASKEGDRSR